MKHADEASMNERKENGMKANKREKNENRETKTGNHPYITVPDLDELKNKENYLLSNISFGDKTSVEVFDSNFFNILSPEKIGQLTFKASAKYCTSFKCSDNNSLPFGKQSENSDFGINVICSTTNFNTPSNSPFDNLDRSNISSLCFSSSISRNSGATNSNLLNMLLIANISKASPLDNKDESTTLTSTTINMIYLRSCHQLDSKYLFDKDSLILSDNSSTSFSVSLDLATALFNLAISSNLDLSSLLANIDNSTLDITLNSDSSSAGISSFNSVINENRESQYLKLSMSDSDVFFDKIISIKLHERRHACGPAAESVGFKSNNATPKTNPSSNSPSFSTPTKTATYSTSTKSGNTATHFPATLPSFSPIPILSALIMLFLFPPTVQALPQVLTFQGVLKNSAGSLLTGTYNMSFRIYPLETGGSQLYYENQDITTTGNLNQLTQELMLDSTGNTPDEEVNEG